MIQVRANIGGVEHVVNALVETVSDLDAPLKRLGKYIAAKTQRRFQQQGPGWAPLTEESLQRRTAQAVSSMERKLKRELRRAEKRGSKATTIERRLLTLAEFRRIEAGGSIGSSLLKEKPAAKLRERMDRAKERGRGRVLGSIASSIKATVKSGSLVVESEIPWAGVHNEGGTAGNGAQIPRREFLTLEEDDLEAFQAFIEDRLAEAMG